ncbi:MAG: phage terminase large subunit [Bryobacterales bacterium]|nr:phage terminase large subunit [Bryobacterales bacterium]
MLKQYIQNFDENHTESDTVTFARSMLHFHPDPIQTQVLNPNIQRGILNCCRQWGKSTTLAVKAVHHAFTHPKSLTVCISPAGRQSTEFIDKCRDFCRTLDLPIHAASEHRMSICLPNGARIIGLPGRDDTTRGFSAVSLLLVDEASRVTEDIISAVVPMLAASPNAALWLLSTPNGCDNHFYRVWSDHESYENWTRIQVTAPECPRIKETFLNEQRRTLAPSNFDQEYLCKFVSADDSIYSIEDLKLLLDDFPVILPNRIQAQGHPCTSSITRPLILSNGLVSLHPRVLDQNFLVGLDLGRQRDHSALSVIERTYLETEFRDRVTFNPYTVDLHRLVHLERFPLRTDYTEVGHEVSRLFSSAPFSERATLVVDATGVGASFVDLLRSYLRMQRHKLMPVVITGGHTINKQPNSYNVPREILLGNLENLTKERTLRVSKHLPLAIDFFRELAALRITTTPSGRQTIQPARSTQHDDMVFSVALAAFADCAYKAVNVRSPYKPTIDPVVYLLR